MSESKSSSQRSRQRLPHVSGCYLRTQLIPQRARTASAATLMSPFEKRHNSASNTSNDQVERDLFSTMRVACLCPPGLLQAVCYCV